jgi:hypothetical protein
MAETFWCKGERVKFSNGAVESLIAHWLTLAETAAGAPGMEQLADFLRRRLRMGDGGRAFGMDDLPEELLGPEVRHALKRVVSRTAWNAAEIPGIDWDAHLQARWEERLKLLVAALEGEGEQAGRPGTSS